MRFILRVMLYCVPICPGIFRHMLFLNVYLALLDIIFHVLLVYLWHIYYIILS